MTFQVPTTKELDQIFDSLDDDTIERLLAKYDEDVSQAYFSLVSANQLIVDEIKRGVSHVRSGLSEWVD